MAVETLIAAAIRARCPRVFPLFAPVATPRPYVTYQLIGGTPLRYTEGAAAPQRMSMVQIEAWDDTHLGALTLLRQIEDDLSTSTAFQARPIGEVQTQADDELPRYGAQMDFEVLAPR